MEIWLWAAICFLCIIIVALCVKIRILQKSAREIEISFTDRLMTETNTLIGISSRDKYMRNLATTINVQLRNLRSQRHHFQQGDLELKNAVTNISHDLRTPLTAIYGYLDLLEKEEQSERAKRYVEIIRNRSEMLNQLTEELFRYSVIVTRESSHAIEQVIINSVLEESIAAFYTDLSEKKITPSIEMTEKKVYRKIDRAKLSRLFSNLINNAIKYSDGDLNISLSETGEVTFSNMASGLNKVEIGKLFDRFYTVETGRKSTGLGLAISRALVEQMNGEITANYENNRLCISIRL